ncbi:MAG TPA: type I polyketide synthase, partial [Pyrinomonadaceae bacterium]
YEKPNPQIDFKKSPFFVASELSDWPRNGHPRRAGVSSFGVGGTNAHIVLEQAPEIEVDPEAAEKQVLVLSARTAPALEKVTDNLVNYLEKTPDVDLADVAFTAQVGRRAFSHRRFLLFDRSDREGLLKTLKARDPQRIMTMLTEARDRSVIFMFSGQGTQYVNMGRELYETEQTFRDHVDDCCDLLEDEMGLDLRDILYPAPKDEEWAAQQLKQTAITQPALFTIEYALARLWMQWGLKPKGMVGHSIGEYVAACVSGVMKLEDALSVVAMRGRLMDSMPGGSMLAVPLSEGAVQPMLNSKLSLAAVNAPSMCVLSGTSSAIDEVEKKLTEQKLPCRRLHTSHAFHSAMMDPVIKQFVDRLSRVSLKPPQIPYMSNVTGNWITPELATSPEYWGTHLRQTVRFADNLRELMVFPGLALVEVGPGQTLGMLAQQQGSRASSHLFVPSLHGAQESGSDMESMLSAVGRLWLGGVQLDWRGFHTGERRRIVSLPTYPFEHQRFWLGPLDLSDTIEAAQPVVQETQTEMAFAATATATAPATTSSVATKPAAAASKVEKDLADWFFVPSWKRAVKIAGTRAKEETDGDWLVFEDSTALGKSVSEHLRSKGSKVNTVVRGDSFAELEGGYQIRAGEKSDYEALIKALKERKESPARILHLWSADKPEEAASSVQGFEEAQERGFFSLIFLAQALAKFGGSGQVNIGVVSDGLQSVLGDETLRSAEATVLGACKVISQEYPNLRCRLVD